MMPIDNTDFFDIILKSYKKFGPVKYIKDARKNRAQRH
jgi:hypothetical protein